MVLFVVGLSYLPEVAPDCRDAKRSLTKEVWNFDGRSGEDMHVRVRGHGITPCQPHGKEFRIWRSKCQSPIGQKLIITELGVKLIL